MNLRTAAGGFVAFLLSVPALQGYSYWAVTYPSINICALRGSTVEIRCNYEHPSGNTVEKILWFTNKHNKPVDLRDDTDYTGRVDYRCGEQSCGSYSCTGTCTLSIKDLRQSDSAEYKFRITTNNGGKYSGVPGVKLSVTDIQMEVVIRPSSLNPVQLECHSMCDSTGLTYNWYKNGIHQQYQGRFHWFYINSDYSASCAVQGSKHLRSPSVYAPETPSVGWTPPGVIKEGSSVNLTCTSEANPVAKYTWTKVTTDHSPGHTDQGQQLSFHSIQSSHSGQYLCTAENDLGTKPSSRISIDVKYGPKNTFVRPSPPGEIMEGGSVTLSCSSDANPAADYTWFKDNQPLPWEPRRPYTLDSVSSKDRGTYRCHAENQYGYLGSNSVFIDVQYAPKTPSVSVRPPGEIKEGGSVTLSCSSDANPAADYTWFREHGGSVEELGENYTISNITTELGGNYYCEARNAVGLQNSTLMFLNVTATPPSPSSPSSMSTTVAAGTVAVLLATMLLVIFLWMRRKRASRKARGQGGRPDTREESPPCPVYYNVSALTNRSASAAQREPIEEQDDPHYASIHISRSKNQEVPRGFAGSLVESDHTEQVLYSAINLKRPKAVPERKMASRNHVPREEGQTLGWSSDYSIGSESTERSKGRAG
ncbi:B-cell receptor CD22 isoform X4 [Gadus morhua]|uniref:B-cell receptor CD22 isoform X4 n=1 Tax=Gadus morhua TaxID=8049 RepID=UPI0011B55EDD|nr:B-cell receptor CD22-like isoform X4 [Gadus morhua]